MTAGCDGRERAAILHDLASPDDEMRRLAFEQLLTLPEEEAIPHLLEGLGDESWRVRKAVVERLVACRDAERVDVCLVEALADGENSGRRNSAYEALVCVGRRAIPKLTAALGSHDVDVRKLAVDTLAGIGDPVVCESIVGMLADCDPNVRGAAADALGVVGDDVAGDAMQQVVVDAREDQLVRLSALRALVRIQHPLSVASLAPVLEDTVLRATAYGLLGQIGDDGAVAALLKGVCLESRASREAAMAALLQIVSQRDGAALVALEEEIRGVARSTPGLVPAAIERLPEADLATRMILIQFLGLTGDARGVAAILRAGLDEAVCEISLATLEHLGDVTVDALVEAWDDLDVTLRVLACRAIGHSHSDAAQSLLMAALDDVDWELRAAAAEALGARRSVAALPALVRRLEASALDDDPDVIDEMEVLIDALVALAPPEDDADPAIAAQVIGTLTGRLTGAPARVRFAIACVLGRIGRPRDEELVADLMKDPDARVRRAAVEALARLEPGAASESLRLALADEAPEVRTAAAISLGLSTSEAVLEDLQRLIHDEDARVSAAAVRSIAQHCARDNVDVDRAVELVSHALGEGGIVALAGIEALCTIADPRAAAAALDVLGGADPDLVQAAIACIGEHGDLDAAAELMPLVSHSDWSVRAEAIRTLADRRITSAVPAILRRSESEQDDFVRDAILRALRQLEA